MLLMAGLIKFSALLYEIISDIARDLRVDLANEGMSYLLKSVLARFFYYSRTLLDAIMFSKRYKALLIGLSCDFSSS